MTDEEFAASRATKQRARACPVFGLSFIPGLVKVARENGYALTLHGSLSRDFDFVAIPWTEEAVPAAELAELLREQCGAAMNPVPTEKPHGRLGYVLVLDGLVYVDLSVMPRSHP